MGRNEILFTGEVPKCERHEKEMVHRVCRSIVDGRKGQCMYVCLEKSDGEICKEKKYLVDPNTQSAMICSHTAMGLEVSEGKI